MAMAKRFRNQSSEQILAHLSNLLIEESNYALYVDPLGVYFEVKESRGSPQKKKESKKKTRIKSEQSQMKPRLIKLSNTKKRINPKIRTVKKGRTVALKRRSY
ncbi:MAG: hypothetical protein ABH950_01145 [Candidatus Altiarchaeota archaeon]